MAETIVAPRTTPAAPGFGTLKETIDLIVDEAGPCAICKVTHTEPYTILTPVRDFNGIGMKRQFFRGRTQVFCPEVAREFVSVYGYGCEPDLPAPKPRRRPKVRTHSERPDRQRDKQA